MVDFIKRSITVKIDYVDSFDFVVDVGDLVKKVKKIGETGKFASEAVLGVLYDLVMPLKRRRIAKENIFHENLQDNRLLQKCQILLIF